MQLVGTSANGFIGMHVANALLERGDWVLALENRKQYYSVELKHARLKELSRHPLFEFECSELTDHAATSDAVGSWRADAVVDLAAQAGVPNSIEHPFEYSASNLDGFLIVLEGCRTHGVRHLVFASSSSVYGTNERLPFSTSDTGDHPVSLYADTKRANELMPFTYCHPYRIPTTGLRFFTVYGPWGRSDMAYNEFTDAFLEGRPFDIYACGQPLRYFAYMDDIISRLLEVLEYPPDDDPPRALYNIGNNSPPRVSDFVSTLQAALGIPALRRFAPRQPGGVPTTAADIAPLQALCGFVPRTSIEQGLRTFVDWYRKYHSVEAVAAEGA
jgi:UDP-glucuronate 4-epimerase